MPLSPRETRRSRRSVPSGSSANSNSPEPAPPPPSRVGSRKKAMKQEEPEEDEEEVAPNPRKRGGAGKRTTKDNTKDKEEKGNSPKSRDTKEKDKDGDDDTVMAKEEDEEEEEQGITRCVCGSTEDDPDAGEFMVQCETCKVWQHGLCMGYESEDQLHDDDYYCEMCRPDMHTELLSRRKVSRKARQISRSHSPTLSRQPAKRRNTMNSRDAAFDENLKEILESTAAEAGDEGETSADSGTKKRKRPAAPQAPAEDEPQPPPKKRIRSASVASEAITEAPQKKPQRGGKRTKTDESAPVPKRNTGRGKGGASKRATTVSAPPVATIVADAVMHDEPTPTPAPLPTKRAAGTPAENRAYRNSHAYVVSQQPLLTSWGLPDYLAHLENIFPTHHPIPLEVGGVQERGVKTKWPGKRMSVGDMNKRVRALVEWVGREQVQAQDRARRRESLIRAVREDQMAAQENGNRPPSVPLTDGSESKTMKLMEELMEEMLTFQERFSR